MRICFYTFKSRVTMYVANRLISSGELSAIILQTPMTVRDKIAFLTRRLRRYGVFRMADEILFKVYCMLFLKKADERLRAAAFPKEFFDATTITNTQVPLYEVDSINSDKGKALLNRLRPDIVVMASRELIDKDVLAIPRLGFVGCHPGIIPEYRGVYASFWAMYRGEPEKVGLSVYSADAGVDTGGIITQRRSGPKFPIRHFKVESERLMMEGVNELLGVMDMADSDALKTYHKPDSPSRLFSHIGLSDYLKAEWKRRRQ